MSQFAHVAVRSCLRSRVIMNTVESGVDGSGSRNLQHYQHCWIWFCVCVCSGVITLLAPILYLPCGSTFVSSMWQCISADKLQHGSASIDYRPSIAHTFVRPSLVSRSTVPREGIFAHHRIMSHIDVAITDVQVVVRATCPNFCKCDGGSCHGEKCRCARDRTRWLRALCAWLQVPSSFNCHDATHPCGV